MYACVGAVFFFPCGCLHMKGKGEGESCLYWLVCQFVLPQERKQFGPGATKSLTDILTKGSNKKQHIIFPPRSPERVTSVRNGWLLSTKFPAAATSLLRTCFVCPFRHVHIPHLCHSRYSEHFLDSTDYQNVP